MNKYMKPITGIEARVDRTDGTQIYTVKAGQGSQTIVFAHGYGFDMSEWNLIWEELLSKENYTLVAFDQMGHGKTPICKAGINSNTMAEDYKTVLEFYDIKDAVLVAHSMGTFIAIKFLIDYPQIAQNRLKSCLLMSAFAGDVNKQNFQNRFQIPLIRTGILFQLLKVKSIANAFVKSVLGENPQQEMIEAFLASFTNQNHKALIPILLALVKENYYNQLHHITLPTAIVIGTRDKTTPPFHTQNLNKFIPNSYVVKIPNKGHCLNWEASEMIVDEIKKLANSQ